jgi:hypothetical protein
MPSLEELKEYLLSIGVPLAPDFMLQAWLDTVAVIQPCLDGAGYPASTQLLIYMYALGLFGYVNADRQISSQSAPSGASQSFRYGGFADRYRSLRALLSTLDLAGCTDSIVPPEPGASAGLWVSKGGCG